MKKLISLLLIVAFATTTHAKEVEHKETSWIPTQETVAYYAVPIALTAAGVTLFLCGRGRLNIIKEITFNEGSVEVAEALHQAENLGYAMKIHGAGIAGLGAVTFIEKKTLADAQTDAKKE